MNPIMPTIPPRATEVSRPYWDACREHRLIMQNCHDCNKLTFFPAYMCPTCGGDRLQWQELSGRGRIHSVTRVFHPAAPVFRESTPYVVALIQVEEGPIMMSNIVGANAMEAAIDDEVQVEFQEVGEITLPRFRLVRS